MQGSEIGKPRKGSKRTEQIRRLSHQDLFDLTNKEKSPAAVSQCRQNAKNWELFLSVFARPKKEYFSAAASMQADQSFFCAL